MSDIIATIRAVIRDELARVRAPEIGIVTEVFPRDSGSSENNHQINIRLRGSGLELQRVAVAAPRLGFSLLPSVGDLMVVIFTGGDTNAPVAMGSVYDADHQPPVGKSAEVVYQPPDDSDSAIRRLYLELPSGTKLTILDDKLEVESGGTVVTVERDGDVTIKSASKVSVEAQGDISLKASGNLQLEAQQNVTLKGLAVSAEAQAEAKLKGATVTLAGMTSFSPS